MLSVTNGLYHVKEAGTGSDPIKQFRIRPDPHPQHSREEYISDSECFVNTIHNN
jgi:hypothetical protein